MAFFKSSQAPSSTIFTALGLGVAGVSTGLALSYPLIINPHFLSSVHTAGTKPLTTAQRLSLWWHSYGSGYCVPATALISSASLGTLYGLNRGTGLLSNDRWKIVGGAVAGLLGIIPFTLGFIMPINNRLHSLLQSANQGVPVNDAEVDGLLLKWTRYHALRVVSLALATTSAIVAFAA